MNDLSFFNETENLRKNKMQSSYQLAFHFLQEHSRYCQSVRYSPDGVFWASGGFDGKIFLYDGKESELITEFLPEGKNAHAGGIYAIAWGANNKSLLSASGDKTCKLWDVENHRPVTTFIMGDEVTTL